MADASDREMIRQAVLDYFEGWFTGDAARMDRALHDDLVKRRASEDLGITSKDRMLELTEAGAGRADTADGRIDIEIADVYGEIASVTVHTATYHEYVQLVRVGDRWRIANTLWQLS